MTPIIEAHDLTKRYHDTVALNQVNIAISPNQVYGLFGRNGAGKSTLMSMITAREWPSSGRVSVFGHPPYENGRVLRRMCCVRESQKYPENCSADQAFAMASIMFERWDQALATHLIKAFDLPSGRKIKKMSRGQQSAVGVIIGMAAQTEVVFFDEPYLGLDATARQLFYDSLLEDLAERPRTVVMSSHLIDEITGLVEQVIMLDRGRVVLNQSVESLSNHAVKVVGPTGSVETFASGRTVLHRQTLGPVTAATVAGPLTPGDQQTITKDGLVVEPVSLQQLIVQVGLANGTADTGLGVGSPEGSAAKELTGAVK